MSYLVYRRKSDGVCIAFCESKLAGQFAPGAYDPDLHAITTEDTIPTMPPLTVSQLDALAQGDADRKDLKATLLLIRNYCNALKDEVRGLAALLVSKGTISAAEATALIKYTGSGPGNTKTVQDLRDDYITAWKSLP